MKLADDIREHVNRRYIQPAINAGNREVTVRAGDVHSEMGLFHRQPAVCGALDAQKFQRDYHVREIRRNGPRQGSSVTWTFEILS